MFVPLQSTGEKWLPCNTEFFYKNNKNRKDGLCPYCKKCSIKQATIYIKNNYEHCLEFNRNYYSSPEWKEKAKIRKRKFRDRGGYSNWSKKHPDKCREYCKNRQSRNHTISKQEWENCKTYFNYECAYCGMTEKEHKNKYNQQLHKEHVEYNGANDLSNCVPSCKFCNGEKWKFQLDEWYNKDNPKFDIDRYDKIHKWLNKDYKKYKE
jgi:hypothetical protein